MELTDIISQLQSKFGQNIDVAKITQLLGGFDHSKMSFEEIIKKIQAAGGNLLGDLDGDGKVESLVDEIKGKASQMFGGMFGK